MRAIKAFLIRQWFFFVTLAIGLSLFIISIFNLEKEEKEFYERYPNVTILDSINDRVLDMDHLKGLRINIDMVSVVLESGKKTIYSRPNSKDERIHYIVNYNSLLIKESNSDTIIVINESSHDTVRHYFTLYQP